MKIAQPKPPKNPSALAIHSAAVPIDKDQEDFDTAAGALSTALGWQGPGDNVLDDIQVADAFYYLRQKLHEDYVSEKFPGRAPVPDVAAIAQHLRVTEPDRLALLTAAFAKTPDPDAA